MATVKSIMSACSLFHKFREPDKTAKLKDAKTDTIVLYQLQLVSLLKTCDWLIITQVLVTRHTHPFKGPFSGTTRVGRYQKGKTNLDFTEARDSEWQWNQLGHMQSAPRFRRITTPAPRHSFFYRPDALPAAQPTASKHWRRHWVLFVFALKELLCLL